MILKIKSNVDSMARFICCCGFIVWSVLYAFKYSFFGFYDWDFALYDQIVWNLSHGRIDSSLIGGNFLIDHAHYIAFLIAPIYKLFPHPLTLLNLELISFFVGAFVFYKIAKKLIDGPTALLLMVLYIIHPANIFMLFYEFHFESLAIAFIFLMFYFMQEARYKSFLVTALLLMLIKENMALIVIMFGIYGFLFKRGQRIRWGLFPLLMGIIFFALTMFVIMPLMRKHFVVSQNIYWNLYSNFGDSPGSIITTLLFHPGQLIKTIGTSQNLNYLRELIGGYLPLALLSPHVLLLSFPVLMQSLLSVAWQHHSIYFHYSATVVPFIVLASAVSLTWIKLRISRFTYLILLGFLLAVSLMVSLKHVPAWQFRMNAWQDSKDAARQEMVDAIPPDASVVASFDFLSHLTHRQRLYAFFNVWKDINYFTSESPFPLPEIDYALIDFNDPWLKDDLRVNPKLTALKIKEFLLNRNWVVKKRYGSIFLLKHSLKKEDTRWVAKLGL